MKKVVLFFGCLLLFASMTACSDATNQEEETETAQSDTIEASVEDATYILSDKSGGEPIAEQDGGLLMVDVLIKNVSDATVDIYPEMNMQLYDEAGNQIDPRSEINVALGLKPETNTSIGAEKQKTMRVMFDVEANTSYDMNISPRSTDFEEEAEDVTVAIDTSDYQETLEGLADPGKALEAYITTIYMNQDTADYETFVSADKSQLQEDAKNKFKGMLERSVSTDIADDDLEKYYRSFQEASAEKNAIEVEVLGNAKDQAIVKLTYEALSYDDISKEIKKYQEKYREKNNEYNREKEDAYALSKFDAILNSIEAEKGTRDLEVDMTQADDKWMIDDSSIDMTERIMRVFAEGAVR